MEGLRVAHLIETDGPGGAERVVADLAIELQTAGAFNVVILPADGDGWLGRQLAGSGVSIEYFTLDTPLSPACARGIANVFLRNGISLAHSHEFSMAVYGAWAASLARVPHVITMHGNRYYAGRLQRRLALRAAIALSSRTVAVSSQLADHLSRDLWVRRSRIAKISNGVRHGAPQRTTLREDLQLGADEQLLVAVGNLYPVKGHLHLIDAMSVLAMRHPGVHVAIAGRGDLAGAIMTRARAHGLAHKVHLLGLRCDIREVLAAADIFVLPSLSEGLPLALLEAMFAGRPIIASDVGDVGSTLEHGKAGVLVEPANPVALANAIEVLLTHPVRARELGQRARRRAVAEYDVSHMVRRYASLYEEVLTPPARRARELSCVTSK